MLVLDALGNGNHVAIESLDLGHEVNYLGAVVRFLSEWVSKQVELLDVLELGQLHKELVEVAKLVVAE